MPEIRRRTAAIETTPSKTGAWFFAARKKGKKLILFIIAHFGGHCALKNEYKTEDSKTSW